MDFLLRQEEENGRDMTAFTASDSLPRKTEGGKRDD